METRRQIMNECDAWCVPHNPGMKIVISHYRSVAYLVTLKRVARERVFV